MFKKVDQSENSLDEEVDPNKDYMECNIRFEDIIVLWKEAKSFHIVQIVISYFNIEGKYASRMA